MASPASVPPVSIDLRSDTVTQPSDAMREAMATAVVGDDVFGEDPTVNALEAEVAEVTGKDAAIFVTSGTQGNLASLLAHGDRGRVAILGDQSHIFCYEAGGASALGGIMYHTLPTAADGTLDIDAIAAAVVPSAANPHFAQTGVICLENTHNRCGGAVVPVAHFDEVAALAARHGLPVHLDGARLFNASVAASTPVRTWCDRVTSVSLCLSKGLAAPVGSVVAGPREFIARVRRVRKMLGGGMRQAGVLAAAGRIALHEMVDRLAEDHALAQRLAAGLAALPGLHLDPARVETNIVVLELAPGLDPGTFLDALATRGVRFVAFGGRRVRAVTHYGITADDCDRAVAACAAVLRELGADDLEREQSRLDALYGRR